MAANELQWAAWKQAHPQAFVNVPDWLQEWVDRGMCRLQGDPDAAEAFQTLLVEIDRLGLMRTLISNIDKSDLEKPRDQWEFPNLLPCLGDEPDELAILTEFLRVERDVHWRGLAAKWLPPASPDTSTAVSPHGPLVDDAADVARWWAALHLRQSGAANAKIVAVLTEALTGKEWDGYRSRQWVFGCTGRGEAARALAQIGPAAITAVPALRHLALFRRDVSFYDAAAARMALDVLTGEPGDAHDLLVKSVWCSLWRERDSGYEGGLDAFLRREAERTIEALVLRLGWDEELWDASDSVNSRGD